MNSRKLISLGVVFLGLVAVLSQTWSLPKHVRQCDNRLIADGGAPVPPLPPPPPPYKS